MGRVLIPTRRFEGPLDHSTALAMGIAFAEALLGAEAIEVTMVQEGEKVVAIQRLITTAPSDLDEQLAERLVSIEAMEAAHAASRQGMN